MVKVVVYCYVTRSYYMNIRYKIGMGILRKYEKPKFL